MCNEVKASGNTATPLSSDNTAHQKTTLRSCLTWFTDQLRNYQTLARFSFSSVTLNVIQMAANIVILRWLDPEDLGLWQSVMLIQSYSFILQLGALNGLNRELPYSMGAGDDKAAVGLAGTAQSVAVTAAGLLIAGGLGSWLILSNIMLRYGTLAVFLVSAAEIYRNYLIVTYRAEKAFGTLANILLCEAIMAIVTLPLVYYFGYWGLAGRYLFLSLFGLTVNFIYRPLHAPLRFRFDHFLTLLKVGLPVYALGYLLTVSGTFPRVILLTESGEEGVKLVGLFAPVYAVMTLLQMIPYSIGQYVYPHMSYRYGKTGDPKSLWSIAWKVSIFPLIAAVPAVLACLFVLPWLIDVFFSKYSESIPAVRFGLISGIFLGSSIAVTAFNSLKAWKWYSIYTGFRVASSYLLPLAAFFIMSDRLAGVAAGFALAHGLSFLLGLYCIYRATHVGVGVAEPIPLETVD
jgi:O-antigen/teichoic acid export membrane protein